MATEESAMGGTGLGARGTVNGAAVTTASFFHLHRQHTDEQLCVQDPFAIELNCEFP